jgi:hypothetical protein
MQTQLAILFGIFLFIVIVCVSLVSAQDTVNVSIPTPEQLGGINLIGTISSLVIGIISIPITSFLKNLPFIGGAGTIVVNSAINMLLMWVVGLFGINLFDNPTVTNTAFGALGVNQTFAAIVFEVKKYFTKSAEVLQPPASRSATSFPPDKN